MIADFGMARHMDSNQGVDAQEVSGTPSFMAPEQILIKQYRLTPATDIYALGAILYCCLTNASPHGVGEADDVIRRAAAGRIRPPRELHPKIPPDLARSAFIAWNAPSDRYANVRHLACWRRARDGLPSAWSGRMTSACNAARREHGSLRQWAPVLLTIICCAALAIQNRKNSLLLGPGSGNTDNSQFMPTTTFDGFLQSHSSPLPTPNLRYRR